MRLLIVDHMEEPVLGFEGNTLCRDLAEKSGKRKYMCMYVRASRNFKLFCHKFSQPYMCSVCSSRNLPLWFGNFIFISLFS